MYGTQLHKSNIFLKGNLFTENDVLQDFKDGIEKLVPPKYRDKLPEVPTKGTLDIYMLKQSEFFFA